MYACKQAFILRVWQKPLDTILYVSPLLSSDFCAIQYEAKSYAACDISEVSR